MNIIKSLHEPAKPPDNRVAPPAGGEPIPAWEQIETGRFRPRRIRGSFPGRELG